MEIYDVRWVTNFEEKSAEVMNEAKLKGEYFGNVRCNVFFS